LSVSGSEGIGAVLISKTKERKWIMVATLEKRCYTPQEYLERERKAEFRSEYDHGVIIPMAGASKEHNTITFSSIRLIGNQIEGTACQGYAQDMQVRVPECDKYYYPDIVVVCGEPKFEGITGLDVLLNPPLIIEVLSSSTERKDREEKFDCYETLASLTDYVLISQHEPRIEHFSRQKQGIWQFVVARGLNAVLELPTIGCSLRLADVYSRIEFAPPPPETSEPQGRNES
jgi:Uma2 family endonuclease